MPMHGLGLAFPILDFNKSPEAEWFIHVDIHDGDLDFEALTIPGIAGSVIIGGNKKTSNSKSLPFKSALKPTRTYDLPITNISKNFWLRRSLYGYCYHEKILKAPFAVSPSIPTYQQQLPSEFRRYRNSREEFSLPLGIVGT